MDSRYRPVMWKHPSNYIGAQWEGWLVFLARNRDSSLLENHNFETALELLGDGVEIAEGRDAGKTSIQTVRENHWACGWVEWIAIHESDYRARCVAEEIADRLDQHPVLNEDRYSERECEAASESWAALSVRDRYELIKRVGECSIFAARRAEMPSDSGIEDTLRTWL